MLGFPDVDLHEPHEVIHSVCLSICTVGSSPLDRNKVGIDP